MAPRSMAVVEKPVLVPPTKLDSNQTLRASQALLRKIQADEAEQKESAKPTLLDDADDEEPADKTPIWLVLTTKKHIVDKKRLKPGKILLPHPYLDQENLRICLITADPQRKYKDLIAQPGFPVELSKKVARVIGMEKIKAKYKSYESRRQLFSEYDVFLADDRIITYLPQVLGKVFYKSGSKRPIPVTLQGKRQNVDESGNKRQKLSEGGSKVVKSEIKPEDVSHEITRALNSALVHLAPSTTTSIKVGLASQTPEQLKENVEAAVDMMVDRYVPQHWKNLRAVHIKGPNTAALPIWMAEELWEDEQDVLDQAPKANESKKRKRGALTEAHVASDVIEVPGPDGKMRTLKKPESKRKSTDAVVGAEEQLAKKRKSASAEEVAAKETERAEKSARKEALKKQKDAAVNVDSKPKKTNKAKA